MWKNFKKIDWKNCVWKKKWKNIGETFLSVLLLCCWIGSVKLSGMLGGMVSLLYQCTSTASMFVVSCIICHVMHVLIVLLRNSGYGCSLHGFYLGCRSRLRWVLLMLQHYAHSWNRPVWEQTRIFWKLNSFPLLSACFQTTEIEYWRQSRIVTIIGLRPCLHHSIRPNLVLIRPCLGVYVMQMTLF